MFGWKRSARLNWRKFEGHGKLWSARRRWLHMHKGITDPEGRCMCGESLEATETPRGQLIVMCPSCARYTLYDRVGEGEGPVPLGYEGDYGAGWEGFPAPAQLPHFASMSEARRAAAARGHTLRE